MSKKYVRIDDFPTGIRPILDSLSIFFKIFDIFEENEIEFHLGIVPDLLKYLDEKDLAKLLSYKYLIPCQHGYNHRYFEFSEVLKLLLRNVSLVYRNTKRSLKVPESVVKV